MALDEDLEKVVRRIPRQIDVCQNEILRVSGPQKRNALLTTHDTVGTVTADNILALNPVLPVLLILTRRVHPFVARFKSSQLVPEVDLAPKLVQTSIESCFCPLLFDEQRPLKITSRACQIC